MTTNPLTPPPSGLTAVKDSMFFVYFKSSLNPRAGLSQSASGLSQSASGLSQLASR